MKTAWLIEISEDGCIEYFRPGGWTKDANDALKFADKKSAEMLGKDYGILEGMDAVIVEHGWPDGW